MKAIGKLAFLVGGIAVGVVATMFYLGQPRQAGAATNDRYQDYIMATGAVSVNPRVQTDGVWLLDYRSGKLLGTVIDRTQGKIVGWAEAAHESEVGLGFSCVAADLPPSREGRRTGREPWRRRPGPPSYAIATVN